jgi:cell division protein FtsA
MVVKGNIIAALDLGTASTKLLVASAPERFGNISKAQVLAEVIVPSRGMRKGIVVNLDLAAESIVEALAEFEAKNQVRLSDVVMAISGSHLECINSSGEIGLRNSEVGPHEVRRVVEKSQTITVPRDREVLHVLPQEFVLDGQDGIRQPVGMSGRKLECRSHVVTGSETTARNFVKCANRAGLSVTDVVASSVALSRSLATVDEQELGVAILDFGAGTTDLSVLYRGANLLTAVFPFGGNHISNDLATGLKISLQSAEEIKCKSGNAWPADVSAHEMIEVMASSGRGTSKVSRMLVSEIVEARLIELFGIISTQLQNTGVQQLLGAGIILTGGSTSLKGIDRLAEKVFGLPVRLASANSASCPVYDPRFSVASGLIAYALENQGNISAFKPEKGMRKVFSKLNGWFAENM